MEMEAKTIFRLHGVWIEQGKHALEAAPQLDICIVLTVCGEGGIFSALLPSRK